MDGCSGAEYVVWTQVNKISIHIHKLSCGYVRESKDVNARMKGCIGYRIQVT